MLNDRGLTPQEQRLRTAILSRARSNAQGRALRAIRRRYPEEHRALSLTLTGLGLRPRIAYTYAMPLLAKRYRDEYRELYRLERDGSAS